MTGDCGADGAGNRFTWAEEFTVLSAGKKLRELREQMGLTLRDVELASTSLAESRGIEEFIINPSRLSDIETKGVIPSIYRLYVLSVIYRADFTELLKLYGVDLSFTAADFAICRPGKTHRLDRWRFGGCGGGSAACCSRQCRFFG